MRPVGVSSSLLVFMLSYCSGAIVCEKVNLAYVKGQANNLCYKDGSREIKCPRNQTLLIPSLLQRVHSPEEYEDPSSCSESVRDNFHDIGRCLLNISDVQEKTTYEAAVREVLQECSQKRYCILENDMTSSIHGLRELPVGKGNRLPSHLVVMHQCVKEKIVMCESSTQRDKEVYISINRLRMSALGTSICTCTVSGGASLVTLLDVRLGNSNRTGLSISDKTGSVYTAHGGHQTVHYMKEIRMRQTEWSLHVNVVQDHVPDKIWMRVQAYSSTQVTVTCEEPHAAMPIPVVLGSSSGEHIGFSCVGFVAGLVFASFTLCNLVKRRSRLSGSSRSGLLGSRSIEGQDNGGAHCSQLGEPRVQQPIGSPDGDDHHYHMPDDTSDHAPAQCNEFYLVPIHRQTR